MSIAERFVTDFLEKASRPGVLGVVGRALELRCQREVAAYFRALAKDIKALKLEEVVDGASTKRDFVRHTVEVRLVNTLRKHRNTLTVVLFSNLRDAFNAGVKMDYVAEADNQKGLDKLSLTGEAAASWAADHVGELIKDLDETTIESVADAVFEGITEQLGVGGTARLIRDVTDGMSSFRARMIASTEMNNAFSEAAMRKMGSIGIEYKQIILSEDACPICEDNADSDPLPIDEDYPSGDSQPPFHPNCRCAITGARGPDSEDDDEEA